MLLSESVKGWYASFMSIRALLYLHNIRIVDDYKIDD